MIFFTIVGIGLVVIVVAGTLMSFIEGVYAAAWALDQERAQNYELRQALARAEDRIMVTNMQLKGRDK